MKNFQVLSSPKEIYRKMLADIENAKHNIYLETYIYENDSIGKKVLNALVRKAKQCVQVSVLIDSFGSAGVKRDFFSMLKKAGGEVRFFRNISHFWRIVSRTHEINHRKMLVIDNNIVHFGSANIGSRFLHWRELNLRLEGDIAGHFADSFSKSWEMSQKLGTKKVKVILHKEFEILQDIPSKARNLTQNKYAGLINSSKKEVLIETPYFVPPKSIRKAIYNAMKRGVKVKILLPCISDVGLIDVLRNRYLGKLSRKGAEIFYYMPEILHSKLLVVDEKFFLLGSSNLDYRSFLHQFDINLLGSNKQMILKLKDFFSSGLKHSKPFSYEEWKSRSSFRKIIELLTSSIEGYL